jgi:hypothetical protein
LTRICCRAADGTVIRVGNLRFVPSLPGSFKTNVLGFSEIAAKFSVTGTLDKY